MFLGVHGQVPPLLGKDRAGKSACNVVHQEDQFCSTSPGVAKSNYLLKAELNDQQAQM